MYPVQENSDAGGVAPSRAALLLLPVVALVVLADEWMKRWALGNLPDESAVSKPGALMFGIHKNLGIAFDIPFRMPLIIVVSAVIGLALLWVAKRTVHSRPLVTLSALTIVLGALGNLYDRLAYGFTVDYIILFGRSAINVSDIVIVAGVVALLYASRTRHALDKHEQSE